MRITLPKLPQVHPAINLGGLLTSVGATAGIVLQNAVTNPTCAASLAPTKDSLAVAAILGTIAAFLPAKGAGTPKSPNS